MTNVLAPMGFVPARNRGNHADYLNPYPMLYSDTSIIGIGDLVKMSSGYLTKAAPADVPMGLFQGWSFRSRSPYGGSLGLGSDNSISPWHKAWNGAVTLPSNQAIEALVDDDPNLILRVQCVGALTIASRGALVDMADSPGGPDLVFGRSKQKVGTPTTYYNITAIAVDGGTQGSGYTQNGVDLLIDGVIQDIRPGDIVVTAGAVTAINLLNPLHGFAGATPAASTAPKPGYAGTTSTGYTETVSTAQTAAIFRIDDVLEQPFRVTDSTFNTTGYDLSNIGTNSWVTVRFAKHQRGGPTAT